MKQTSGLYYKHVMIINDDARIINKLDASLTDDARVVIYDRPMFIVQATACVNRLENYSRVWLQTIITRNQHLIALDSA